MRRFCWHDWTPWKTYAWIGAVYDATRLLGKIQKRGWVLMSKRHLVLLSRSINRKVGIIIKLMELQAQKPSAVQEYRQRKRRNRRK